MKLEVIKLTTCRVLFNLSYTNWSYSVNEVEKKIENPWLKTESLSRHVTSRNVRGEPNNMYLVDYIRLGLCQGLL